MIHVLVTRDHQYTLSDYLRTWGSAIRERLRIVPYEGRPWRGESPPGAWVFADIERLRPSELEACCRWAGQLATDPSRWRVLNDPRRALGRRDLLQKLSERHINHFRAYRLADLPATPRFPVFLRGENDHAGSRTALLADAAALRDALQTIPDRSALLVVEFLDYARADGLFVKYSVMRVGDHFVRRHVLFSRQWMLKMPDLLDEPLVAEEAAFVTGEPSHLAQVAEIFSAAGIDYGRIDYTLLDGKVQVFEINTNPTLVPDNDTIAPQRRPAQRLSARMLNDAFDAMDVGLPAASPVELRACDARERRVRGVARLLDILARRPRRS